MIFNLHVSDPEKNSIRELSQRFGLGLKRVEAIIRLKGEEVKWQMVSPSSLLLSEDEFFFVLSPIRPEPMVKTLIACMAY